ncbi:MAG: hypothetical protein K940chlam8_00806 [Chlamydiae bacterium]|nr:hypothetical protein [Chlamydiota bacterium]
MSIAFPKTKLLCSIQKLNVTTTAWNRLLKHVPESMRTLALFIDEIVKHYVKENKQHLKYEEIDMKLPLEEEEKRGFDIKVFVATHSYKRPVANFLAQLDEENQFKETTHHFLIFFYRTVRTVDEIFTLTMGKAWEVVKPYRSFAFPIAVTKRLMEPGQSTVRSRDLVGSTYSKVLQYKAPHERVTESEDLDQITFFSKFFFREDASIYDLANFRKRIWCADVGLGIFKINKAFNFKFYFPLLDHLAEIFRHEPTQTTDSEPETDDNIGFMFLERVCQVDVEIVHRLDDALKRGLYAIYSENPAPSLDFVHRYTDDYFASRRYTFVFGPDEKSSFNIPPTSNDVMKLLRKHFGYISEDEFRKKLFEVKVAFLRKGSHFSESIFKFFEGEVVDKQGCHYFKLGGIWWSVRAEFFILIQQDFERLLTRCLISQDETAQLKRLWLPSKDLAGFTRTDFEKTTQEPLEAVSGQLKRKGRGSVGSTDDSIPPHTKKSKKTLFLWKKEEFYLRQKKENILSQILFLWI